MAPSSKVAVRRRPRDAPLQDSPSFARQLDSPSPTLSLPQLSRRIWRSRGSTSALALLSTFPLCCSTPLPQPSHFPSQSHATAATRPRTASLPRLRQALLSASNMCFYRYVYYSRCGHGEFIKFSYCDAAEALGQPERYTLPPITCMQAR